MKLRLEDDWGLGWALWIVLAVWLVLWFLFGLDASLSDALCLLPLIPLVHYWEKERTKHQ